MTDSNLDALSRPAAPFENTDKTALYTAVTLLKGLIMERALLLSPDVDSRFLKSIERATDALISDIYTQTNDRWEWLVRKGMPTND